jgi:hypothetical protein
VPTLRFFFARTFVDASASGVAWRMSQTVNARDRIRRSYCCPTAAKSLVFALRVLGFLQDLQEKQRADERTRTADLLITSELLYLLSYVGLFRAQSIS